MNNYNITKPLLTVEGQINHLKEKGVKFEIISEEDALNYLSQNNNYFKLTAYRKNFEKNQMGVNAGKYSNLDFAMLVDLAVIDMRLRYLLLTMCLDVEHYLKVDIIRKTEERGDDGYKIVKDFINSLIENDNNDNEYQKHQRYPALLAELNRNEKNLYCGDLIAKYKDNYPIWAFVELISFGKLLELYRFFVLLDEDKKAKSLYYRLKPIKDLRNACAHNNCIINDLRPTRKKPIYPTDNAINKALSKIGDETRTAKLSNERLRQIATLLYTYNEIVPHLGVYKHRTEELHAFVERTQRNSNYYKADSLINTSLNFIKKIVDKWFPL